MSQRRLLVLATRFLILLLCLSTVCYLTAQAQQDESIPALKKQAADLIKQARLTEALPLLEKIVAAEPLDAQMQFYLGSALLGQVAVTNDEATRKALRIRARRAFIEAKELGVAEPNVVSMIQSLSADGSEAAVAFSQHDTADALMKEAEAFFAQGKMDEALEKYQKALTLDPKLYHAALFSGDAYMTKGDFAQAEVWYQKAIDIDPTKETAYRYSATPLMKQRKTREARDRYIEAFITEPYNSFARGGLVQWAQATKTNIGHPAIDIPTNVTYDEKGDVKINLDASALLGGKEDGSSAWIFYGVTRSSWHKEKFAKAFPAEKAYRHSLAEEADALKGVINLAVADKKVKTLSPSLAKLKKLNDEGLLEAYILLARPDAGIAEDHPAYLQANRDKLRKYMVDYVVTGGGN